MQVEVELVELRIDERQPSQMVILKEKEGERLLPIIIGTFEAQAIQTKLSGLQLPRPLTHDLILNIFEAFGAHLERVIINNLQDNTFFARLILRAKDDDRLLADIDSRPSDAIAIALRAGAPIYVEDFVLASASPI